MAAQLTSVFNAQPSASSATPPSTPRSASSPASAHLRELERLLGRLRYATGGLSYYDMWDHGGSGSASDAARAEAEADRARCNRIYNEAQAALEALVPKLRAEAPREIQAWVEAHDAYLAWVIADHLARGEPEASNVDYAKRDRGEWAKVRDGALVFVEERVDYSQEGKERYRELFGFEWGVGMSDDPHRALRAATAARIAKEAAARGTTLTLRGTTDPWPPAKLQLWLFDQSDRLLVSFERFSPPDWATLEELLEALAPWLGELPFGEKDALSNAMVILTAAPGAEPVWRAL